MTVVSAHRCDIGRVYTHNDDFVLADDNIGLYIVADGVGGNEAGDVASRMTVTTIKSIIVKKLTARPHPQPAPVIKNFLIEAIETANHAVYEAAQKAEQKRKMGTTVVSALLHGSKVYISHAGDSRAYLARGIEFTQLTEDDSWQAQFGPASNQTDNSKKSGIEHFLTNSVGQDAPVNPSFIEIDTEPGDWLLLCSDGLWNMVDDGQLLASLQNAQDTPDQAVESMVKAANAAGGKDNISVIAIKILP